jgi:hypothetical protein
MGGGRVHRRAGIAPLAVVVTVAGCGGSGSVPVGTASRSTAIPEPSASVTTQPAGASQTSAAAPSGWNLGPLIEAPTTDGLVTVSRIDAARHDGSVGDGGLRFDRLSFRLTPGVGATAATRVGWDVRYLDATTLQLTLRQGGAWRTERIVDDVPETGMAQIRSYAVTYLREGADLRLRITVRSRAPMRIVDLPENGVLALDVLNEG